MRKSKTAATLVGIFVIAALLLDSTGCSTKTTPIRSILREPDEYYDKQVTVEGYVWTSEEWSWIGESEDIYEDIVVRAVYSNSDPPIGGMGNRVKATGVVREHTDPVRIETYPFIDVESWSYTN